MQEIFFDFCFGKLFPTSGFGNVQQLPLHPLSALLTRTSSRRHIDPILIKKSFRRIDLVHRKVLQRVHQFSRIPKIRPQRLPSLMAFQITIIIYFTRSIGIDMLGPDFPLDEQNGGVVDAALV